jgi:hypothetical protein
MPSLRGVTSLQGAILLAERGMTADARTLARSCFESLFYLGAALADATFVEALISDNAVRKSKQAKALLGLPQDSGLEQEQIARLRRFLDGLQASGVEVRAVKILGAAKLADLGDIYETYYRGLSNDAAHPSVESLNRHFKAGANGDSGTYHWGPDAADVADTLIHACTAAIYLAAYAQSLVQGEGIFDDLDECWDRYTKVVDVTGTKGP